MTAILISLWSPNRANVAINYENELIIQGISRKHLLESAHSLLRKMETDIYIY